MCGFYFLGKFDRKILTKEKISDKHCINEWIIVRIIYDLRTESLVLHCDNAEFWLSRSFFILGLSFRFAVKHGGSILKETLKFL